MGLSHWRNIRPGHAGCPGTRCLHVPAAPADRTSPDQAARCERTASVWRRRWARQTGQQPWVADGMMVADGRQKRPAASATRRHQAHWTTRPCPLRGYAVPGGVTTVRCAYG